jgi:hypothetical protein
MASRRSELLFSFHGPLNPQLQAGSLWRCVFNPRVPTRIARRIEFSVFNALEKTDEMVPKTTRMVFVATINKDV